LLAAVDILLVYFGGAEICRGAGRLMVVQIEKVRIRARLQACHEGAWASASAAGVVLAGLSG